jgi:DNA-directed RNA polymerase subunit RPC12/RpoP
MIVKCSNCGNPLDELPMLPFMEAVPDLKQWHGNVCTECKRVYCASCIEVGGPTPCPACGHPTDPAQLIALRQIGVA